MTFKELYNKTIKIFIRQGDEQLQLRERIKQLKLGKKEQNRFLHMLLS